MTKSKFHSLIQDYVKSLQQFANRPWYAPLIGFLAALDNLIIIIPNDGILISSSMLIPKKWLTFAIYVTIGSTVGAFLLERLVELQGLPWILDIFPSIKENQVWNLLVEFFDKYGLLVVFIIALTPLMQQPAIIFASISNTPLVKLIFVLFLGRLIKYLIMAYVGSHSPRLLKKMWGVKDELADAGIKID